MIREATDDFRRFQRDKEVNSSKYVKLSHAGKTMISSSEIKVGDIIYVEKGSRVPADMVLLRTTESSGSCFIRTDQLDGETDWKLRLALTSTQKLIEDEDLLTLDASVYAEKPQKDIHSFIGKFTTSENTEESLSIENTIWSNTVVASGTAIGLVIYTGPECRATMNNSKPSSKMGLIDLELNDLTKILFLATVALSVLMIGLKGFDGPWYIYIFRFILLFSYLVPISLRVNLDMGKIFYSWSIGRDSEIPGTQARSTTIPEELGRISYLMSDKTGTLTSNKLTVAHVWVDNQIGEIDTSADENPGVSFDTGSHSWKNMARVAVLCNGSQFKEDAGTPVMLRETTGDPTETALLRCVEAVEGNTDMFRQMHRSVIMIPFNPMTRIQVSIHECADFKTNGYLACMIGSPDVILQRCGSALGTANNRNRKKNRKKQKKETFHVNVMGKKVKQRRKKMNSFGILQ